MRVPGQRPPISNIQQHPGPENGIVGECEGLLEILQERGFTPVDNRTPIRIENSPPAWLQAQGLI